MAPDTNRGADAMVFSLGPSFATQDAARLHDALSHAAPDTHVEIDFRGVREWEAAALAVLARDLAERGPGLEVRGLSSRQLRLLCYLGAPSRAERDPDT